MPAYTIHSLEEIHDPEAMQEYAAHVDAIIEQYDGTVLVPRGDARRVTGGWDPGVLALVEWPTAQRFTDFYDSPEYRPWRELRDRSTTTSIVITES
jgi:uncharacterized protein (DUF1330 family)